MLAVGCNRGELSEGVVHLDPALRSGIPPAKQLRAFRQRIVSRVELRHHDSDPTPWGLIEAQPLPSETPGLLLRGTPRERVPETLLLRHGGPLSAEQVDFVEVDLTNEFPSGALLRWRRAGDDQRTFSAEPIAYGAKDQRQTVRFVLTEHDEWYGDIVDLTLEPAASGTPRVLLHSLRLGLSAYEPGHDADDEASDGGLVARGHESLRAWPSDFDVPLLDSCKVPFDGRVVLSYTIAKSLQGTNDELHFLVDARRKDDPWENIVHRTLRPAEESEARWHQVLGDLDDYSGEEIELRLRCVRGEFHNHTQEGTRGRLERARVFWGAPIVLGKPSVARPPNVVLVTVDSLRPWALGTYMRNDVESRSPFLDRFAEDCVVFEDAWSASNSTTPAHASIMTGLAVKDHGVVNNYTLLAERFETVAEALRAGGYYTAGAVSAPHLEAGKSGLGQGFDQFLLAAPEAPMDGSPTIEAVREWLFDWKDLGERPFFLWVHLFDVHTPYEPPEDFARDFRQRHRRQMPPRRRKQQPIPATRWSEDEQFLENVTNPAFAQYLYMSSVAYVDTLVSDLVAELELSGFMDTTALILTADHGESLGERDLWFHHRGLFNPVLRIPLLVRLPWGPREKRIQSTVSSIDLGPTILNMASCEAPAAMRGRDLMEVVTGKDNWRDRRVWFESTDRTQVGCRDGRFHFVQTLEDVDLRERGDTLPAGTLQLFARSLNLEMGTDMAPSKQQMAIAYRNRVEGWLRKSREVAPIERTPTAEELASPALGYSGD